MFRSLTRLAPAAGGLRPPAVGFLQILQQQQKRFAGHSKWQNIRHVKGLKDAQRATLFTKLSRQIKVAITDGGSADPKHNLKLEQVIEQTRRANMPMATVQSVIKSTQLDKSLWKGHLLEIKGPGSCIILCEVFTDNLHHLRQQMASILRKHSSKFSDGGGRHLFEQKGVIDSEIPAGIEGDVLEVATEHAIESGAEDVKLLEEDKLLQFICGATNLRSVTTELEKLKYNITSAETEFVALKEQKLSDEDLQVFGNLYDKLMLLPEFVNLSDNISST